MPQEFTFIAEDKQFILGFEQTREGGDTTVFQLHRADQPDQKWSWEGKFSPNTEEIVCQLTFQDGINFEGKISLFQSMATNEEFVFLDAYYGLQNEIHFEGNIFALKV